MPWTPGVKFQRSFRRRTTREANISAKTPQKTAYTWFFDKNVHQNRKKDDKSPAL